MEKAQVGNDVFIAKDVDLFGPVTIGDRAGLWFHSTIRTEGPKIIIGEETNIQDNCVLHTDKGYEMRIGDRVTIGHGAIVHGCVIEEECLIGMGAILLNGCHIGKHCIIGAGALIPQGKVIPDGSVVVGNPGKVLRQVSEEDVALIRWNAKHYVEEKRFYQQEMEAQE